jgi:hypothetical protein
VPDLCDLCGEARRLREAFWARDLAYCDVCWQILDALGEIPWFEPDEDSSDV